MIKSLRAMLDAGASAEMIVLAVEAAYSSEDDRRARQAAYMRDYRKSVSLRNLTPPSLPPPMINNSTPPIPSPDISIKLVDGGSFEGFWSVYPRKIAKGSARKAYRSALRRASADEILAGAKRYKPDPQFTKHPATWLNADCWLDEPDRSPNTVLTGPWKPMEHEPDGPKISDEERQANLAKLATVRFKPRSA